MENKYLKYSSLFYNDTKPPGTSVDGDLEFYKNLLLPIEGKILEAGVGNGRLLIPFLKYKMDIEGIDKSDEMIDLCNENLNINNLSAKIIKQDLCDYIKQDYYEFIIMPNASFCLIESYEKAIKVLKNFYCNLIKDGKLAIDLIWPNDFHKGYKHEMIHNLKNKKLKVINYSKEIDWLYQFTINEIDYFYEDKHVENQKIKISWYGVNEFKNMLKSIGFVDIEVVINYNFKSLINIKTITFIAKK
ncbi:methyltransferase [Spiroplasma helicoides]|uniref:Methyltransferase n=1 Tax=Spiroplasma helicoides TaxID=216938 RepID=A0A1B3SKZ1_9MOLU|nr:class I SAM-dependent methyltransferase [Spiroplasma helicoides]AOG60608.1 methyltransferase [Spiroplasma helicoides]